jgi:hypothetical protein
MTPDWTALDAELAAWDQAGLTLPLWWRDDDAVKPTPALDQYIWPSSRRFSTKRWVMQLPIVH